MAGTDPGRGAKAVILGRIRAALADRPTPPHVPRAYARAATPDVDVVGLFAERAGDYRATVEIVAAAALPAAIATAFAAYGARRIVVPPRFPEQWLVGAQPTDGEWLRDAPPLGLADLDGADGVLTTAALGIALTGTIVLDGGDGQGRRVLSLLPDLHVCILPAERIVATVPEGIARLAARRPQTWISGPSATSDIELNRVEGVHGPRTLHILVVA